MPENIGPVMLDVAGTELSSEECKLLSHPMVGGVILFSRNYVSLAQIKSLCQSIRETRQNPILIAVDHEGGRVQRFKEGFTRLPSMGEIGLLYDQSPLEAVQLAEACGWIMAAELLAVGVDLSFAPVLDLNKEMNQVIGDRSFSRNPAHVAKLAGALIDGMHAAGMAATGKHFPGHGTVKADSHTAMPVDERELAEIMADDMQPFIALQSRLDAVMPAHILFPAVDKKAVGFSEYWLQSILRTQLQFKGVIFSDDLNMDGAGFAGDYPSRAEAALSAGCDMVLICNNSEAARRILDSLEQCPYPGNGERLALLQGKFSQTIDKLQASKQWLDKQELINRIQLCSPIIQ